MAKPNDLSVILNFQNTVVRVNELAQEVEDAMLSGASAEELSDLIGSLKFQAQIKLTEDFREYKELSLEWRDEDEKANEEYVKRKVWRSIE